MKELDLAATAMFSVGFMSLSVIDTASAMIRILDAPEDRRADLVREMWEPMAGLYRYAPGEVDLAQVHRQSFGFAWDRSLDETRQAVEALVRADAWNRMQAGLERSVSALREADPDAHIPDVRVLLVIGDADNSHFVNEIRGLAAVGGIAGYIAMWVWPHQEVLDRLEAIVAHEIHHNVRYSPGGILWNPATVTVGEQVIAEGLADVFAAEFYGERGYAHFVADETWRDDAVLAKVVSGLGITGMENFTAWVHGDPTTRVFGGEPVGLPTGAGYAAGVRLVHAYLDASGGTAAQHVRSPSEGIISVATELLGLGSEPS